MADSRDMAAMLHRRLNTYGGAGAPGSLTATPSRRAGAQAHLDPLPVPASGLTPALRKRGTTLKRDASAGSFVDATGSMVDLSAGVPGSPSMVKHSPARATLAAGTELLNASAPMPFRKMARHAPPVKPTALPASHSSSAFEAMPAALQYGDAHEEAGEEKRDPFWFIRMLRTELSDHEFAYMNMRDTQGTVWNPYDLKIVAFNEVDPVNHYTISEAGVTHCRRIGKSEVRRRACTREGSRV